MDAFLSSYPATSPAPSPATVSLLSSPVDALNAHFLAHTYLAGHRVSKEDFILYQRLVKDNTPVSPATHASLCRWIALISLTPALPVKHALAHNEGDNSIYNMDLSTVVVAEAKAPAKQAGDAKKAAEPAAAAPAAKDAKKAAAAAPAEEKKEKEKKEKKDDKKKEAAPAPAAVPQVYRCDFRVGVVLSAVAHPSDAKCLVQTIDFGEAEPRCVVSGIAEYYKTEEMKGKRVVGLINLDKANIKGVDSFGRLMVATAPEGAAPMKELATPPEGAAVGERITFDGVDAAKNPADGAVAAKNTHKIFKELKTNAKCEVAFGDILFMTKAGPCTVKTVANGTVQ